MPMNKDQMPTGVREFREKLRAFDLALAEWLGLDPAQVFRLDLTEGTEPELDLSTWSGFKEGDCTRVTWKSTEKQAPRIGHVTHGAESNNEGGMFWTAELLLDWPDDQERIATVGRRPGMFSAAEEARLRAMFA